MNVRTRPRWAPVAVALGLLIASVPALADETEVHIRDRNALLVGEPTDQADLRFDPGLGLGLDVGTYKTYDFTVENASNRLVIDLLYEPATVTEGPCLKGNDLDLAVSGPDMDVSYPGCDGGEIKIDEQNVTTGAYTVRVEADQGSTVCVPDDVASPCTSSATEYRLDITVWHVQ